MRWFLNLKMKTKMFLGFAPVGVLMIALGLLGLHEIRQLNAASEEMSRNCLPSVKYTGELNTALAHHRIKEIQHILSTDDADMSRWEKEMAEWLGRFQTAQKAYKELISSPEELKLYGELEAAHAEYLVEREKIIALSRQNQNVEARDLFRGKSIKLFYVIFDRLNSMSTINSAAANSLARHSAEIYSTARTMTISFLAVALALAVVVAMLLGRVISRPLAAAVDLFKSLANGDFTKTLDITTTDEIGQMARSVNQATASIRKTLLDVRSVADNLAGASQQLSASAEDISAGAQEQASSLEETASSLEEITSTVKQNADNSQQANQLACSSREIAEKGSQVVQTAVAGMSEINTASKKIADIITAIDEIAFQTNLLALNAAVEAARAGEQGRGFAVVAAEVRNLSQRSAAAAKEIKGLIQDSVRKVETGTKLVNQSGQTLQEIVISVKRVTDIVAEIAAASREQSTGIDQVSQAVAQMDQVTQSNAAQTEEMSGTAESLAEQARQLKALVLRFVLGNEDAQPAAASRPAVNPAAPPSASKAPVTAVRAKKPDSNQHALHELDESYGQEERPELELVGAGSNGSSHLNGGFEEF